MDDIESNEKPKGDRKQVGLPRKGSQLLEEIIENTPWFKRQLDAYRIAISVALARDFRATNEETSTYETKFSLSTLDPEGELRELVLALAPECGDRPYEYAQRLANKGIHYLHNELVTKGRPLPEVLGSEETKN
jgi:hypothetical protein